MGDPDRADRVRARRQGVRLQQAQPGRGQHGQYISDEICDRFCLLGDADAHIARLRELEQIGVRQVNLI